MLLPKTLRNSSKAFTLVELIIVMGILAVLLALVLVALNPGQRFIDANNTQRRSDVNNILNAIQQYIADKRGVAPSGVTANERQVSTAALSTCDNTNACATGTDACVVLGTDLANYIASIPCDPQAASCTTSPAVQTRYTVQQDVNTKVVTVKSCDAEDGEVISVAR